jgi:hypothetical protein
MVQRGEEATYHEQDEEARIFTKQGMQIIYFPVYHSQVHIYQYSLLTEHIVLC